MAPVRLGGAVRPLAGETSCGDAFVWWNEGPLWTICLADGLGHGPDAAEAAHAALDHAKLHRLLPPVEIIGAIDEAIRHTRGVAVAVVQVNAVGRTLSYAGVGNVRAGVFGRRVSRFEGKPGIVGTGRKLPMAEALAWQDGDLLLIWTDGFDAHLDIDQAAKRQKGNPGALADRLIDEMSTRRDDAGLVCCLLEGKAA